jgi:DNA recombination protein RmuC
MTALFIALFLAALAGCIVLLFKNGKLGAANAKLQAELDSERKGAEEKAVQLKTEFENLANRIFEERGNALVSQSQSKLGDLLKPLEKEIGQFRQRVDTVHTESVKQSSALLEQVRQLQDLSKSVSDEAVGLAEAIKGNAKTQGDWGELVLERILEASGLTNGREYESQASFRDDENKLKRPDFVVHLPGDKSIILDSKVSLTAYERYANADDEDQKEQALKEHLLSVRKHIEELNGKDYTELLGNKTLDFVIMCIPIEPAYQTAMEHDKNLLYDLAKSRVVLTGPATLMITLKLIAQIWRRENEQRNAVVIAEQAGRMYDQVRLVLEAVQDARKKMDGASDALDLAEKRIGEGRGNLVKRVEDIRTLGAKVKAQLPADVVEKAIETADEGEPPA